MPMNLTSESFSAAPNDFQIGVLEIVAATVEKHAPSGKALIYRLKIVASEKFSWVKATVWLGVVALPLIVIFWLLC